MSCPLSYILNSTDVSPIKRKFSENDSPNDGPAKRQKYAISQSSSSGDIIQSASYDESSLFALASERGNLYHRRTANGSSPNLLQQAIDGHSNYDLCIRPKTPEPPCHEMNFGEFNIFKALLNHAELIDELAKQLELEDLISLYAISKDFHYMLNLHFTPMILAYAKSRAFESAQTFRFKCYKNLCIFDPVSRPNEEVPGTVRYVPSFRWLRMVLFREKVVNEIVDMMAADGHFMPQRGSLAIRKIWFVMDISDCARRIALFKNETFWENRDLFSAQMFFIKLDMYLTDPVDGNGETSLRKMLLAQRSLSTLWKAMKREILTTQVEAFGMYVAWKFHPPAGHRGMAIAGVHGNHVGRGQIEGWGAGKRKLLRPDELVLREGIRRSIGIEDCYLDMMLWGYVNQKTFQNIGMVGDLEDEESGEDGEISEDSQDTNSEMEWESVEDMMDGVSL
ncbi:hypothetical protein MMC09_001160 [Bachmanniomyces sp. S44760]|nr:hypothetical protein [Bachmanniomyces sp. S44760]